jgi:hypothetical protein
MTLDLANNELGLDGAKHLVAVLRVGSKRCSAAICSNWYQCRSHRFCHVEMVRNSRNHWLVQNARVVVRSETTTVYFQGTLGADCACLQKQLRCGYLSPTCRALSNLNISGNSLGAKGAKSLVAALKVPNRDRVCITDLPLPIPCSSHEVLWTY